MALRQSFLKVANRGFKNGLSRTEFQKQRKMFQVAKMKEFIDQQYIPEILEESEEK